MVQDGFRQAFGLVIGVTLLFLAGCGGASSSIRQDSPAETTPGVSTPIANPGSLADLLPAPSTLREQWQGPRRASYVEADVVKSGSDFQSTLPHGQVTAIPPDAELAANWTPGSPLSDLAYATYHFVVPGYDRNAQVRLAFPLGAPPAAELFVGLAQWNKDRWQWFGNGTVVGNEVRFNMGSFVPYLDFGGNMLLVVALTGTSSRELEVVRLGALPPVAAITATPTIGSVPLEVNFDASASTTPEGTITKYEWDVNGDGIYDFNTDNDPLASHIYNANETAQATVRVTNSFGSSSTMSMTVHAIGQWTHTWGRSAADDIRRIAVADDGSIYGVGTTNKPSGPLESDLLLTKWSPTGDLLWAKTFDSGDSDYGLNIAIDSEGSIVTSAGTDIAGSRDVMVIRWSPDGTVQWVRRCGGSNFEQAEGLVVDSTGIYLAGDTSSLSGTNDLFMMKYDLTGSVDWQAAYDHGEADSLTDFAYRSSRLIASRGLVALIEYSSGADQNICKIECNLEGAFSSAQDLGDVSQPKYDGQLLRSVNIINFDVTYYIGGIIKTGGQRRVFLSKTVDSVNEYCTILTVPSPPIIEDMVFGSNSTIVMTGFGQTAGLHNDALIYKFDRTTGDCLKAYAFGQMDWQYRGYGLYPYYDGLLIAGYGEDATANWIEPGLVADTDTLSFTGVALTSPAIAWASNSVPHTIEDITAQGTLDTGAGNDDCLLTHRTGF